MEDITYKIFIQYAENIILSVGIILFVWLEIWLINKGLKYLKNKVLGFGFRTFRIHTFNLIDPTKQRLAATGFINLLHITAILLVIYFSLILILSLFSGTEMIVNSLIDFIFIPLKNVFFDVVNYLPKLFSILITIIIFLYLIRLIKTLAKEVANGNIKIGEFKPQWAKTTGSIVNFILYALMVIFILPYLPGYESIAFKGVAAFIGALITIGGSSVIANFMAGIVITYMNACQVGDWVQIEDTTGEIVEKSHFSIKLQTAKKIIVSIPNTRILRAQIINYSGEHKKHQTYLHTTVSIGYDVPWKKVNELLIKAAKMTDGLVTSVSPFVRQIKLDDFYIIYELNVFTKDVRQMHNTYSELHKHILEVFSKEGVEILSPHYRAEKGSNQSAPAK